MAQMKSSVGKTYPEIWENFKEAHPELPESDLKRLHQKWKWLSATS